jgi:hypothetical protein
MLALCRRLGIREEGPWQGSPGLRLVTVIHAEFEQLRDTLAVVDGRVVLLEATASEAVRNA